LSTAIRAVGRASHWNGTMSRQDLETSLPLKTPKSSRAVASKLQRPLPRPGAVVGRDRLSWHRAGDVLTLHRGQSQEPLAWVEPDTKWRGMFRARTATGLSDISNLTRAKDAALTVALRHLNHEAQERPEQGTYVRAGRSGIGQPPFDANRIPPPPKALPFGSSQ